MGDDGLVEAITGAGCPMCAHVARVAPQYLDSLLYQHTTDRAYRDRFLAGGGFCGRHVRAAVVADTAGNGDGVGGGIFLRSQLAARRRALEGASGFRAGKRIREATRAAWDCPVCENERTLAGAAAKLPAGTVETLVKPENKATLTNILTYHAVAGKVTAADVVALINAGGGTATIDTIAGKQLTAELADGKVVITDAAGGKTTVTQTDVKVSNGVIHVTDGVFLPA